MILLSVHNLSRQFDREPLFAGVTFDVRPGEKIGIVGPNGTGKSTLLRILAGHDEPDIGQVNRHGSARIEMLKQQVEYHEGGTLLEVAKSGLAPLYQLQEQAEELANQIGDETETDALQRLQKQYDRIQHELQTQDAYNIDHRVDEVLQGLGFSEDQYDRPLAQFSGGQQSRAVLGKFLLSAPNVMLLDEPTNHLDIESTEWLEGFLKSCPQTVILVSHDRYVLDKVTDRILELNDGRLTSYPGNFSAYWKLREERNLVQQREYQKQQGFIAKTEDFIRRNKYGQKHAQAADRVKKLERLERISEPTDFHTVAMNFGDVTRTGDWVIDAVDMAKGYGEPLFRDFTFRVFRGDRIGILGPNGSGKTTLIRTLLKELEPDQGSVRHGTGVKFAFFDQHLDSLNPQADAIENLRPDSHCPDFSPGKARDILARFGLRGDIVFQHISQMSGGEKNKVALARLALIDANVLVLDEPTNHLDLWARASLEEALQKYEGTLLIISHDRYFLDRVVKSIIAFEPTRVRTYDGNYSDYADMQRRRKAEEQTVTTETTTQQTSGPKDSARQDKPAKRKRKFPYRKISDLETEIAEVEQKLQQLQSEMSDPEIMSDHVRAQEVLAGFAETESRLNQLYEHWEEAAELG